MLEATNAVKGLRASGIIDRAAIAGILYEGRKGYISVFRLALSVTLTLVQHGILEPANYTNLLLVHREEVSESFSHGAPHGQTANGLSFGVGVCDPGRQNYGGNNQRRQALLGRTSAT